MEQQNEKRQFTTFIVKCRCNCREDALENEKFIRKFNLACLNGLFVRCSAPALHRYASSPALIKLTRLIGPVLLFHWATARAAPVETRFLWEPVVPQLFSSCVSQVLPFSNQARTVAIAFAKQTHSFSSEMRRKSKINYCRILCCI